MRAKIISVHGNPVLIEADGLVFANANALAGANRKSRYKEGKVVESGFGVEMDLVIDSIDDVCAIIAEKVQVSGNPLIDGLRQVIELHKQKKKSEKSEGVPLGNESNPVTSTEPKKPVAPMKESSLNETLSTVITKEHLSSSGTMKDASIEKIQESLEQYGWTIIGTY